MDIDKAGDQVSLAKWIIKQVAEEMGLFVTFMPKPLYKMPGNGMHVHQFLESKGKSIFREKHSSTFQKYQDSPIRQAFSNTASQEAFWLRASTNSCRRLVHGYEAPVSATFAKGSRAAAVRIRVCQQKRDPHRVSYRRCLGKYLFLPRRDGPCRSRRDNQGA